MSVFVIATALVVEIILVCDDGLGTAPAQFPNFKLHPTAPIAWRYWGPSRLVGRVDVPDV